MKFHYYENEKREIYTLRKAYRAYRVMVDDEQKASGTDFKAWLLDMQRTGLFVKA